MTRIFFYFFSMGIFAYIYFLFFDQFYFPAQLVRGFTLSDLLDKP